MLELQISLPYQQVAQSAVNVGGATLTDAQVETLKGLLEQQGIQVLETV